MLPPRLRSQPVPLYCYRILAHLRQVIVQLQAEPEFRRAAKGLCKPYCHLWRNSSLPVDQVVQCLARHAEALGGFRDGQAEGLDTLVPNKLAWVGRVLHGHNSLLMVIDQVNIVCAGLVESKRDPPVSADRDGPDSLLISLELVEAVSWNA